MVVDAAVAVAVHDHVHLGGARSAGFGVAAEDAPPCQPADAGIGRPVVIVRGKKLPVERGEGRIDPGLLLLGGKALRFDLRPRPVLLGLDLGGDPAADVFESTNEEAARTRRGVADQLVFPRVEQVDHEVHHRAGREELAELAPERAAEELLEGEPLDVVPGLREIEAFELLHDAAEGFLGDFEAVGAGEEIIGSVVVLRPLEQVVVDERIAREACRCAAVEEVGGEGAVQARAFDVHLHEQDLRNRVEGASGIHLVHVAQDRVAPEQEVLELPPVEGPQPFPDLLDPPGVAPIRRLRDFVDLHELARYAGDQPEHGGVACIVGDEKLAAGRAGVALALVVVPDVDVDVLGLALDDEHRRLFRGFGLRRFPDHDVGARAPVAVGGPPLLGDLFERVAVVVAEVANEMLAHGFFRLPRHVPPFLAQGNPEPVAFPVQGFGCRRKRRRGRGPGLGRCLGLLSAAGCVIRHFCFPPRRPPVFRGSPSVSSRSRPMFPSRPRRFHPMRSPAPLVTRTSLARPTATARRQAPRYSRQRDRRAVRAWPESRRR